MVYIVYSVFTSCTQTSFTDFVKKIFLFLKFFWENHHFTFFSPVWSKTVSRKLVLGLKLWICFFEREYFSEDAVKVSAPQWLWSGFYQGCADLHTPPSKVGMRNPGTNRVNITQKTRSVYFSGQYIESSHSLCQIDASGSLQWSLLNIWVWTFNWVWHEHSKPCE